MYPANFDYIRPRSVDEAVRLLQRHGDGAKVLAGGHSLIPAMKLRLATPNVVLDIARIAELSYIRPAGDRIAIGATTTHVDIETSTVLREASPLLAETASHIGDVQVRNKGTIGGSLSHADPSADWISILAALGATVTLRGPHGLRTIPVEDYMLGALEADLRPGELLVSVKVPRLSRSARWGYHKLCRKTGEFAHAIGAFVVDPDRGVCRAVIGATESRPIVIADARPIVADGNPQRFDRRAADALAGSAGMNDPLDRQTHVVALRRAVERAACR